MPRRKFWRRGAGKKKGDSHPSNHGFTIDNDQLVNPPVKKEDKDQVNPPVKKALDDEVNLPPEQKKRIYEKTYEKSENIDENFENIDENIDENIENIDDNIENIDENFENTEENSESIDQNFENIDKNAIENYAKEFCESKLEHEKQKTKPMDSPERQNLLEIKTQNFFMSDNCEDDDLCSQNIDNGSTKNVKNTLLSSNIALFASHCQSDFRYSVFSRHFTFIYSES